MSDESTAYEKYVRGITETLLRAQGLETVSVQHDVPIVGTSRSHQIDVYWEYRLGGLLHRVIINCKRYRSTVEVTDVLTLSGVLADMPGVRGLIVTTIGFQKGAVDFARQHQIGLKIIRPPQGADWEGRIPKIELRMNVNIPEMTSCSITLDPAWIASSTTEDAAKQIGERVLDARAVVVHDLTTGSVDDMNALWNRVLRDNPTDPGTDGVGTLRWEDARLEEPGAAPVKIDSLEFRWRIRTGETETRTIRREAAAIVRDAIAGTLLFVDPEGRILGDVEQEFGGDKTEPS